MPSGNQHSDNVVFADAVYDPFVRGACPVGVRTVEALDEARGRRFLCEIWYPAAAQYGGQDLAPETHDVFTIESRNISRGQMAVRDAEARPGAHTLIVFSHASGHHRRGATFLCTHLSSHGYVVAALDHSEVVAAELRPRAGETAAERSARAKAVMDSRVPDTRFLLRHLLDGATEFTLDRGQVGIVGHSLGAWTALMAIDAEPEIRAIVALGSGSNSPPKPGILPVTVSFTAGRNVPILYLAAENDVLLPIEGMYELFSRTPEPKQLVILRRADHEHFMDNVEEEHEALRNMPLTGDLAWISREMRPIAEFCSGEQAHLFTRGLTLCHMDAILRRKQEARQFLAGDIHAALAGHGIAALAHKP